MEYLMTQATIYMNSNAFTVDLMTEKFFILISTIVNQMNVSWCNRNKINCYSKFIRIRCQSGCWVT
jgi:hypothetical protein